MHAEKIGKGTPPEEFTLYALLRAKRKHITLQQQQQSNNEYCNRKQVRHLFIKRRRREGRKYYEEEEVSRAKHTTWIHR